MTVALSLPPALPAPPLEDLARALSRAALFGHVDLGDDRQALALLHRAFPGATIDTCFESALTLARSRAPQNAKLFAAAGHGADTVGFGIWLALAFLWCILCPVPARAAGHGATPDDLLLACVPVAIGLLVITGLICIVLPRRIPEEELSTSAPDEVARWNGEGR